MAASKRPSSIPSALPVLSEPLRKANEAVKLLAVLIRRHQPHSVAL